MTIVIPSITSESDLRRELYVRVQEQERPPILGADPEYRFRLTSALQKSIRRGHVDDAVRFAGELHSIDPAYAWRRLAVIALEDVGFGDPLSAALALEANRSFVFRQKLGELLTLATVVTGLADATKSRAICDLLTAEGTPHPTIRAAEFRAHASSSEAPWLLQYLATRGFSHADLGRFILPVYEALREIEVKEHPPDMMGDELIAGLPACAFDQYTHEGKRTMRYLTKCPPFRGYSAEQIGMCLFWAEGAHLDRSLCSKEIAGMELAAKLVDWSEVGFSSSMQAVDLLKIIRDRRDVINYARRRVLR